MVLPLPQSYFPSTATSTYPPNNNPTIQYNNNQQQKSTKKNKNDNNNNNNGSPLPQSYFPSTATSTDSAANNQPTIQPREQQQQSTKNNKNNNNNNNQPKIIGTITTTTTMVLPLSQSYFPSSATSTDSAANNQPTIQPQQQQQQQSTKNNKGNNNSNNNHIFDPLTLPPTHQTMNQEYNYNNNRNNWPKRKRTKATTKKQQQQGSVTFPGLYFRWFFSTVALTHQIELGDRGYQCLMGLYCLRLEPTQCSLTNLSRGAYLTNLLDKCPTPKPDLARLSSRHHPTDTCSAKYTRMVDKLTNWNTWTHFTLLLDGNSNHWTPNLVIWLRNGLIVSIVTKRIKHHSKSPITTVLEGDR